MPDNDAPSRAEIDAKIEASSARMETKIAEVLGEVRSGFAGISGDIKAVNARLDHISGQMIEEKSGRRGTNGLVIGSAISVAALVLAALAYGASLFGAGISAHDVAASAVKQVLEQTRDAKTTKP